MKKLLLIFLLVPILLNAQIRRAFLFEQNGLNIYPTTTLSNLLPYSNQLGNLGSNSIRWNFGYFDTTIANHLVTTTFAGRSMNLTPSTGSGAYNLQWTASGKPYYTLLGATGNAIESLDTLGNRGIGTTGPTNTLDVNGGFRVQGAVSGTATGAGAEISYTGGTVYYQAYNRAGGAWLPVALDGLTAKLRNSGVDVVTVTGGNVSIGTTSPSTNARLTVVGGNSTAKMDFITATGSTRGQLSVTSSGGLIGDFSVYDADAYFGTDSNIPLYLKVNAIARMTLLSNGSVGIGTIIPYAQYSQVGSTPIMYLTDSDINTNRTSVATATDTSAIMFDASAAQPTLTMKNTTGLGFVLSTLAGGGASFDGAFSSGAITMSAGAFTGNTLTRGANSFDTTATTDTVAISGAAIGDYYSITLTGTAAPLAADAIRLEKTATGFILWRSASGTSGLTYDWFRQK